MKHILLILALISHSLYGITFNELEPISVTYRGNFNYIDLGFKGITSLNGISTFKVIYQGTLIQLTQVPNSYIDLCENQIENVSAEIGQLVNALEINFCENPIKYIDEQICKLTKLESINLKYTGLTEIPSFIGEMINLKNIII